MWLVFATLLGGREPGEEPPEDEVQGLVRAARQGDAAAARRLYELHVGRVFRAVRPLCASDAEAEDLTQDTFVKALGALGRYERLHGKRFVAWLLTIALNTARKRARRRGREDRPLEHAPEPAAPPGQDALEQDDARRALRGRLLEALAGLSDRDRHVVCLRYGAGLEASEVAELTGMGAANVRKICERQRRTLLAHLERSDAPSAGAASAPEVRP